MTTPRATTVADLDASHFATLRKIAANPRCYIQPQRMAMLRRLGLVDWAEDPRPARPEGGYRRGPEPRAKVLTASGVETLANAPAEVVKPKTKAGDARDFAFCSDVHSARRFR